MRRTAVFVLSSLVLLAGCGGGSTATKAAHSGKGSAASSAPTSASAGTLPTVAGSYGTKPSLTFAAKTPPRKLETKVLKSGTGQPVAKGDLLIADYLGQVWRGKVFDNSYDRKQPAAFRIGVGQVIPGWDVALVGVRGGSRVLLVVPPDKGYGAQGQPQAGIPGNSTLVFVVDVVRGYAKGASAPAAGPTRPAPTGGPKVTAAPGGTLAVTVPAAAKPPTKPTATVLAKGTGAPVKNDGLLVFQYTAVTWDGKTAGSTWKEGGVPVGAPVGPGSALEPLVGVPVGSRVLLQVPAQKGQDAKKQSVAIALEIVAEPGPAASS